MTLNPQTGHTGKNYLLDSEELPLSIERCRKPSGAAKATAGVFSERAPETDPLQPMGRTAGHVW